MKDPHPLVVNIRFNSLSLILPSQISLTLKLS